MCKLYQTTNAMQEHDMQTVVTKLRVGSGAAGAAAIKDLLLLRSDKASIDYDMPDFLDNAQHLLLRGCGIPSSADDRYATGGWGKGKEPLTSLSHIPMHQPTLI